MSFGSCSESTKPRKLQFFRPIFAQRRGNANAVNTDDLFKFSAYFFRLRRSDSLRML